MLLGIEAFLSDYIQYMKPNNEAERDTLPMLQANSDGERISQGLGDIASGSDSMRGWVIVASR